MKMFEPSQSLWRSRRQEPPCLPVQEQCCSLGTGREMLSGVATETSRCSPSSFDFAWTESSARHWELVVCSSSRQDCDGAVFEAFLQSVSCSHSPPFPSPHPRTGTTTYGLFPSSFLSAQTTHTKVTSHSSLPSRFLLTEMLCDSFSVCLSVLDRGIPWKQRYFTEVPFTARKPWYPPAFTNPERARNTVQFVQT